MNETLYLAAAEESLRNSTTGVNHLRLDSNAKSSIKLKTEHNVNSSQVEEIAESTSRCHDSDHLVSKEQELRPAGAVRSVICKSYRNSQATTNGKQS